jgi:hypothetical protein
MSNHQVNVQQEKCIQALITRIFAADDFFQGGTVTSLKALGQAPATQFNLEAVLASGLDSALEQLSGAKLDRIRRKIEVARKLYGQYEGDLSRPASSDPLSCAGVHHLCAVLLLHTLRSYDLRYLNSALKLIDGFIVPADAPESIELMLIAAETLDTLVPLEIAPS